MEHSAAEILELVGNAARDDKKQRVVQMHMQLAIRNDEEYAFSSRILNGLLTFSKVVLYCI